MIIDLGETWSSPTYEVKDAGGNYADAGTVTYVITLLDATIATGSADRTATGRYAVDYLTAAEGLHEITITATGGVLGAMNRQWRESFTVERARLIVGVDDAVAFLRGQAVITSAADRELLRDFIQTATDAIERDLGRVVVPRLITETAEGGKSALILRHTPVASVISVTELGTALGVGTYTLDPTSGILYRGTPSAVGRWSGGWGAVVVTYRAGWLVPPPCLRWACLGEVAQMWRATQQSAHRALDDYDAAAAIASAAGPSRSRTLIGAYENLRAAVVA